jgi:hypothetical protein
MAVTAEKSVVLIPCVTTHGTKTTSAASIPTGNPVAAGATDVITARYPVAAGATDVIAARHTVAAGATDGITARYTVAAGAAAVRIAAGNPVSTGPAITA